MANHEPTEQQSTVEAQLLARLSDLLRLEDNRWEVADILNQLRSDFEWTFEKLADQFDYSRARLVQLAANGRAFRPAAREIKAPFIMYEYARVASDRVAREVELHTGTPQEPDYVDALQFIVEQRAKGERLTDQRAVTSALAERARVRIDSQTADPALLNQLKNKELLGRCHNRSCVEVINELADASVKLFHFDPPFGNYRRDADGHLDMSTSTAMTACDNYSLHEAVAVTVAAIRAAHPKLVRNGVILLWQASTMPRAAIAQVIEELDMGGVPFLIWNKRRPKLGDAVEAIQYSTEVCFVLCRRREKPLLHDAEISKLQVIDDIPPITFSSASIAKRHQMEKPVALLERLLRQFTREGDSIVDGFGCSGSCCVAAERLGRAWTYCESNADNFAFGKANIEQEALARETLKQETRSA